MEGVRVDSVRETVGKIFWDWATKKSLAKIFGGKKGKKSVFFSRLFVGGETVAEKFWRGASPPPVGRGAVRILSVRSPNTDFSTTGTAESRHKYFCVVSCLFFSSSSFSFCVREKGEIEGSPVRWSRISVFEVVGGPGPMPVDDTASAISALRTCLKKSVEKNSR